MVKSKTKETLLLSIWTLAVVATVGSLFYSEVIGYVPCELCWVQRIFMYPLVVIYGVAAMKRDVNIAAPGFILSMIGFFVSLYHYLVQKLPTLQDSGDRKSTRLNSSHVSISYAVFCLKKKTNVNR